MLLTVSATGEKLKLLVIGKSKKPQCFYGFEIPTLGVDYDYSKKTMAIFTAWLNNLNNRMRLVHIWKYAATTRLHMGFYAGNNA